MLNCENYDLYAIVVMNFSMKKEENNVSIDFCFQKINIMHSMSILPADTGTLVIKPSVTNILYVTAELNCVKRLKTAKYLQMDGNNKIFYFLMNILMRISLPSINMHAINRDIHDRLPHGNISVPDK